MKLKKLLTNKQKNFGGTRVFKREYIINLSSHIKEDWNKLDASVPDFLQSYLPTEKQANEQRTTKNLEQFKNQMNCSPRLFGSKRKWREETEQMIDRLLWEEPLINIEGVISKKTFADLKNEAKCLLRRIRSFDSELSVNDMGQAVRNYLVYAIFLELNSLPQKCTASIFGYSMLYPYTDNYIDSKENSDAQVKHYNKLIFDKLSKKDMQNLQIESEYEQKTVELLSAIEEDYNKDDDIFNGLLLMLEAQKISLIQSEINSSLNKADILDISIYKGGLSVLIDRYFINKPMTEADWHFYYGFGFLLQLCDDLQDISEDRVTKNDTLFSTAKTTDEVEQNIYRLLNYADYIFNSYISPNEPFKEFLRQHSFLLILISALGSKEHLSSKWLLWLDNKLPVSIAYIENMKESISLSALSENNEKLIKMLDEFLD